MFSRPTRPRRPRRGITLVEMLVAVALLVLMMTVIVQVFTAATSAVSASRTYQELDGTLHQLDAMIRTDLLGVTARFKPPLDPNNNLGYFELGENSHADVQGEDCDDYIRFTAKAPEGQLFTGRMYVAPVSPFSLVTPTPSGKTAMTADQLREYLGTQPITITSQYAEIIYFLRNGNLYRRILLVAPERQKAVSDAFGSAGTSGMFRTGIFGAGIPVSWQGVNDLSAHPAPSGNLTTPIVLNTLGDLTNRENRFAYQRFGNDFVDNTSGNAGQDSVPDDQNQDTVPDFYPSLYYNLFASGGGYYKNPVTGNYLVNENQYWPTTNPRSLGNMSRDTMAFPYVFPGMFSRPDPTTYSNGVDYGMIHTPDPSVNQTVLADLRRMNHNPLEVGFGDSLPRPPAGSNTASNGRQTWWGFPLWRETMDSDWNDPYWQVHSNRSQPTGLSLVSPTFLPPMTTDYRVAEQPFNDLTGSPLFATYTITTPATQLWRQCWEDDLIATGVRSFDVKAYDDSYPGYVDLGWGDDVRLTGATNYLSGTPGPLVWNSASYDPLLQSFAHEGRMPPLSADNRADYQYPVWQPNVGDDTPGITRLRRVWDSWSTDYSYAIATGVDSNPGPTGTPNPNFGMPLGPPFSMPIYPSYAPPYPMALRGIQIQIRIVDPRNERIKTLTIRQDFSDKL